MGQIYQSFALKNASKYCKTYNGDIEKLLKEKKIKTKFDYILFSHVIEHLKNPIFVLKKLREI